jgi:hypothetical protein
VGGAIMNSIIPHVLGYEVTDGGLIESNRRPLVYTTVYGDDSYYECLGLFLRSLEEVGGYNGDIAIFADRSNAEAQQYAPDRLRPLIDWRPLGAPNFRSRYIALDPSFASFGPILYFDTDIVVDRPINRLIGLLTRQRGVSVTTESERYPALAAKVVREVEDTWRIGNWWGLELLRADPACADYHCQLVNSGILAFDHYATFETVSRLMSSLMDHPRHEALFKYFGDQPFLNYVLARTNLGSYEILRGLCSFVGTEAPVPGEARGFSHFVWAQGAQKQEAMRGYLEQLLREGC